MTLFDVLKEALGARGWAIPQFARQCDVSAQLAYKWLAEDPAARITPSPVSCQKIAAALGLEADYILELAGHREPQVERASMDPDIAAIAAVWPSLEDGIRHAIRILSGVGPVTVSGKRGVSAANGRLKRHPHGQNDQLLNWSHPGHRLALAAR